MRTVQDILLDVTGQTIVCDAMEGRPSSVASVTVYRWASSDNDTAESAAGSPTVETNPNTTTDAAAGTSESNPKLIPLTATTSIEAGRRYLLTDASSLKEWVEVDAVASGVSVTAKHPLHNDYASGATFASTRMTATIDSTWVTDESNVDASAGPNPMFRARWVYAVAGVTYVADTYFNLVRYAGKHGVLPQDVEAIDAGWLDRLPIDHRHDQGRRLIDEAYRAVKIDLHEIDLDDAGIAESEVIDELTRLKASGDAAKYQTRLDALVRLTVKVPVRDVLASGKRVAAIGLTRR